MVSRGDAEAVTLNTSQSTFESRIAIEQLSINIIPTPRTFVAVPGYETIWDSPERACKGVYLWCIEHEDSYLANYVGKTFSKNGFAGRLWKELLDWRRGWHWNAVDIDAFLRGQRVELETIPSDHLDRELAALQPAYRIFLIPLDSDDDCKQVESVIVNTLRKHPFTFQFLGNRDKDCKYNPKPTPTIQFPSSPRIIGLTTKLPAGMTD